MKLEPKTKEQKARTKEQIARQSLSWSKFVMVGEVLCFFSLPLRLGLVDLCRARGAGESVMIPVAAGSEVLMTGPLRHAGCGWQGRNLASRICGWSSQLAHATSQQVVESNREESREDKPTSRFSSDY